ncbi:type IV pili signal transduction protein [Massilia eurypsychrophila]|jgi:twitching motility protein PilI|uniref:Type IV pili signal transduction protein n=1 Tax=Massilia eurypsychrophila TaxID=1485217 RepID=A0A2G8TKL6_9BURK|nr:chemotaxis protein CheW [Massilia eurypsychrophila]PIL46158.1 type IV pili signal transduction protein [Massilia eurypsychrophila]
MTASDNGVAAPARLDAAGRRTRLRQYQVQLLERMQAARANTGASVNQLGVQIGADRYLLDLTQAGEIVPLPPVTVVPLTQPWYLGLANIRGNLVGIIDLARYLGLGDTQVGADSRIVTFAGTLGFNCGLLVGRVYGLRHAAGMQAAGDCLRDTDGNDWTALDLAALVGDERFLHVGI